MGQIKSRHLAYVGRIIPSVSETFVVREIAALRDLGLPIKVFSVHAFNPAIVHPEAPDLKSEVEVLTCPSNPMFWLAHVFFLSRFPGRYLRCLKDYVMTAESSRAARLRCFQFFLVAPFFALRVLQSGITHIHAHFANVPTAVAMMAASLAGVTFSFTIHSRFEMLIDRVLMPQKLRAAEFIATISRFNVENYLLPVFQADPAKISIVRCGIDCEKYSAPRETVEGPPMILSVGRLSDTKGFPTLISACRILRERGVVFRCVIVGDGPDRMGLEAQIKADGVSNQVTLAGELLSDKVLSLLRKASLFVLPCQVSKSAEEAGNHDGIPYALVEAMAMGIPTVSTRIGGIPELILNGRTGLLLEPEDPLGLADAMASVIGDPDLAARLSSGGRDMVLREFNVRRSARQLFELFTKDGDRHVRDLRNIL
ncbi:MAG: glycosyltransferase family 4 protein [Desulfobacteraceae bacterium]|nr:glycosyltransferase family 4 protein [Desulfobacteraceae bacterium]